MARKAHDALYVAPLLSRFVHRYLNTPLRGRTRLTRLLARHSRALQAVPVRFATIPTVYMDLRMPGSHEWFAGSPWTASPREPDEQRVMTQVVRPGDVAFDIGANIGLHTALLSRLVGPRGRVHAFEPNPDLAPLLRRTAREAGNCELHTVALSDEGDAATLFVPEDHSMASLADWTAGQRGPRRQVPCERARLDDLVDAGRLPPPDFIKCDVEGAELRVFRGARRLLDRPAAPIVLFEANANTSRGFGEGTWAALDFLAGLERARYDFHLVADGAALAPLDRGVTGTHNVLAVPEQRRARILLTSS